MSKHAANLVALSTLLLWVSGCVMKVGPVEPQPEVDHFDSQIDLDLSVYVDPEIPDEMTIESTGLKNVELKAYRGSLKRALEAAFSDVFEEVVTVDEIPESGLVLALYKARPKHVKKSAITHVSGYGRGPVSSSVNYEIAFEYRYKASLIRDGVVLSKDSGTVEGDETTSDPFLVEPVFRSGLEALCERLATTLFTPEVLARLAAS